jgi:outer membrane biosynthesis protein TonB
MTFLDTKSKKKSFVLTVILFSLFLLLLFVLKMEERSIFEGDRGVAVNFGTMDMGSGDVQPLKPIKTAPKQQEVTPPPTTEAAEEEVITQDVEDAPVIADTKPKPKETVSIPKEEPKEEVVETPKPPKPDQSTNDALASLMGGEENDGQEAAQGEGNDASGGDKGNPNGNINDEGYTGTGGSGGNGNYQLGGRSALTKPKEKQNCNEYGRVAIKIWVNRSGKVIKAEYTPKGTTNSAQCLRAPALRAAKATKWSPKTDAPTTQTGKIIYNFSQS